MRLIELERMNELSRLKERLMLEKKSVYSEEEISNYKKLLTSEEEVKLVSILLLIDDNPVLTVGYDVFADNVKVSIPNFYTSVKDANQNLISAFRKLEKIIGRYYYKIPLLRMDLFTQFNGFKTINHEMWIATLSEDPDDYKIIEKEKNIETFDCTLEEALGLIGHGYIDDINTVLSLTRTKLFLRNFYQ